MRKKINQHKRQQPSLRWIVNAWQSYFTKTVVDVRLHQGVPQLFVGSVSSGIVDLLWKENDNLSLSPLSDLGLLYSLLIESVSQSTPISAQETVPQNLLPDQQEAALIPSTSRCFSIQVFHCSWLFKAGCTDPVAGLFMVLRYVADFSSFPTL